MANAQVEELKPMTEEVMRELIQRYYATMRGGQPNPAQVEAIIRFARGLPMVVTSAVQLWVKYGVEDFQAVKPEIVANLVDRLMEGVPKGMVPALEAAAIVRWFDQPILRAVMAQEDVRDAYNELRRFPFVRARAEGLALHDAVREIMDENLRVQDAERHRELHEQAAAYFEKRLEKATGEDAERLGLERLYHRIRADEETGIQLFREMAEELVRYRMVNRLRALLNDANTYPLERENSRLWREYYETRILHLENQVSAARERYERLISVNPTDLKLRAYVMADYGDVLRQLKKNEQAISYLEKAISAIPIDTKLVWSFHQLAGGYRRLNRHADAWAAVKKVKEYCAEIGDRYGLLLALDRLEYFYTEDGDFRQADAISWTLDKNPPAPVISRAQCRTFKISQSGREAAPEP
jgi:tetratricopeptide (TPR) repeat protein